MPFDQFVNTRIFAPLKMQSSYWTVPADKVANSRQPTILMGATAGRDRSGARARSGSKPPELPYGGAGLV